MSALARHAVSNDPLVPGPANAPRVAQADIGNAAAIILSSHHIPATLILNINLSLDDPRICQLVKLLTAYWPSTSFAIMCRHFGCLALADDASQI